MEAPSQSYPAKTPFSAVSNVANTLKFEVAFQAITDGVAVFDVDRQFIFANDAQARICGYASVEELKKHLSNNDDVFELSKLDGNEPLPQRESPISRTLRGESLKFTELKARRTDTGQEWVFGFTGEPIRNENGEVVLAIVVTKDLTFQREAELRAKEAEERLAQAHAATQEHRGRPARMVGPNTDITATKQSEDALKESEAKFRTMTDAMPQMVWSALPDGSHDYFNKRWYEFTGLKEGMTEDRKSVV